MSFFSLGFLTFHSKLIIVKIKIYFYPLFSLYSLLGYREVNDGMEKNKELERFSFKSFSARTNFEVLSHLTYLILRDCVSVVCLSVND